MPAAERLTVRQVVVGRHSAVWRRLESRVVPRLDAVVAIGHGELNGFRFHASDRVWLMSYSHSSAANSSMLETLKSAGVGEVVYVSSSSTIVTDRTDCYRYPRVKAQAERAALCLPNAKILTLGLMHESSDELPAGPCVATSYDELAEFLVEPNWPAGGGRTKMLFRRHDRPYRSALERWLHSAYGTALRGCSAFPCLLRPVDMVLRACGMRWYGYVYLSNSLWTAKTS